MTDEEWSELVQRLQGEITRQHDVIAKLEELLRSNSANRYWEGRWRDTNAEVRRTTDAMAAMMEVFTKYYREEELIANREGPQIGDADQEPKP